MTADEYDTGERPSPSDRTGPDAPVVGGDAGDASVWATATSADFAVGRRRETTGCPADHRSGDFPVSGDETHCIDGTEATLYV